MQNLGSVITNPSARKAIYGGYVILVLIVAATTVGYATAAASPQWLNIVNAVVAFLGAPIGTLAVANVAKKEENDA